MKLIVLTSFFLALFSAAACTKAGEKDKFSIIHVEDLSKMMASSQPPAIFDVNPDKVRKENGIIRGAVLLDSSNKYDLNKLPADKKSPIVFYCHSSS